LVGLHYLLVVWPKRSARYREATAITLLCAGLLSSWFTWSLINYGANDTFASNTTATDFGQMTLKQNLMKVLKNQYFTLVPHPFNERKERFDQPNRWGFLRDYLFLIYQTNIIFAMGCVGGPLVLYQLARCCLQRKQGDRDLRRFWIYFAPSSAALGIAVHPTEEIFGVAHICAQPLILIGITFLAVRYVTLPRVVRWLVWVGLLIDFFVGVYLHFTLENHVFRVRMAGEATEVVFTPDTLSYAAFANYVEKTEAKVSFLGDGFASWAGYLKTLLVIVFFASLIGVWVNRRARQAKTGSPTGPVP
jgi:hypothetical protein